MKEIFFNPLPALAGFVGRDGMKEMQMMEREGYSFGPMMVLINFIPMLIVMALLTELNVYEWLSEPEWLTPFNDNPIKTGIGVYCFSSIVYIFSGRKMGYAYKLPQLNSKKD